jgi:hypothetical protein
LIVAVGVGVGVGGKGRGRGSHRQAGRQGAGRPEKKLTKREWAKAGRGSHRQQNGKASENGAD